MHMAAMQFARPGMKEFEVAAKLEEAALNANGRLSYPIILTINGQVLHNHYHGNVLKEGDMVLCDAGAENVMHYAGDLTRTFPVVKSFTSRQQNIYQIVLDALHHAVKLLGPGVRFIDVHTAASIKLMEGLKSLDLVKGDAAEAVNAGAHTLFFQCGLGHMMGLDVHDMEDLGENYVGYSDSLSKRKDFGWKSLRLAKELKAGFVLTVEPGIYIIPELIDRWEATKHLESFINYKELAAWRNFGGIRIENNYVISSGSHKLFGKPLPETVKEIQHLRSAI
jgi:Xaa-Pro aminopeptidase